MRINDVLANFLASYRKKNGLTLDQIANASKKYETGWSTGSIASFEDGKRTTSIPNLIILLQALSDLTGVTLRLADVVSNCPDDIIQLTDNFSVKRQEIQSILQGNAVSIHKIEHSGEITLPPWWRAAVDDVWRKGIDATRSHAKIPPLDRAQAQQVASHIPTLSEKRAAKKLEIPTSMLVGWCISLFGKFLDETTSDRIGENASPQKKGRETRKVLAEIQAQIDEKNEWLAEQLINGDI